MINLIAKSIVSFLINQNAIKKDDEEVYVYGLELITSTSISLLSTLLLTLLFSNWYYFVIFYIFFIPLRIYAGGFHANSYESCFFTTILVYTAYILILNKIPNIPFYIIAILLVFSIITIFKFAPVIHKNNIITEIGVKKRRFISRLLIIVYALIISTLLLINLEYKIIIAIGLATTAVTISIIINILFERREKNEKVLV